MITVEKPILTIICGVSCTLKSSTTNRLLDLGFTNPPDVNRELLNDLNNLSGNKYTNLSEIDEMYLVEHRLKVYENYLRYCFSFTPKAPVILNRTIFEHKFFVNNRRMLPEAELTRILNLERDLYSKFAAINVFILENENEGLLERAYFPSKIRSDISLDKTVNGYRKLTRDYRNFILNHANKLHHNIRAYKFVIPNGIEPTTEFLSKVAEEYAKVIAEITSETLQPELFN